MHWDLFWPLRLAGGLALNWPDSYEIPINLFQRLVVAEKASANQKNFLGQLPNLTV
jgi:hypothetical protein